MKRLAVVLLLAGLATSARAVPPPVIAWRDAGEHVGDIVTVEGDVVRAGTTTDGVTLEFGDDPRAFRVILLVPLFSDLPRHPEQLYAGKRVRASGRVERFHGRTEMVLRTPDQIEVVDVAAAAPVVQAPVPPAPAPAVAAPPAPPATHAAAPPSTSSPPPSAPPPTAAAPSPSAAAPPVAPPSTEPPPPRGLAEAVQRRIAQLDACEKARARWRDAGATARAQASALTRCLDGPTYGCRTEAAALAPALSELEWAAQQVEAACP